jgi:rare lipoprotein A
MVGRVLAALLLLQVPFYAQEEDRKPSPFPEKNAKPKSAKSGAAKDSHSAPGRASGRQPTRAGTADRTAAPAVDEGQACYFSPAAGLPGDRTADSDAEEFLAAHGTYPPGSRLKVTNLANGRTVEVRVVDRLPDSRRIVSVSTAAAKRLGFYEAGVARVRVELVSQTAAADER